MVSEDALFEATRHHLYRRAYAEGTTDNITEDCVQILLATESQLLAKPKGRGDIKSKAKRMAEYMQNEFVIYKNIKGYAEWSKEKRNAYMRPCMKKYGDGTCQGLQSHIAVLVGGKVVPRCLDCDGVIELGDPKEETLDTILSKSRTQNMIRGFNEGKAVEDLCQKCSYKGRFNAL